MSTAGVEIDESKFKSLKSITEKIDLDKDEMKALAQEIVKCISQNEELCRKAPRNWKTPAWKDLIEEFLHDSGRGKRIWSTKRHSYTSADELAWPDQEDTISVLTFALFKFECSKYFSNSTKRKSVASGATSGTPAKKSKAAQTTNEDEGESESNDEETTVATVKAASIANKATKVQDKAAAASEGEDEEGDTDDETPEADESNPLSDEEEGHGDPFTVARAASRNSETSRHGSNAPLPFFKLPKHLKALGTAGLATQSGFGMDERVPPELESAMLLDGYQPSVINRQLTRTDLVEGIDSDNQDSVNNSNVDDQSIDHYAKFPVGHSLNTDNKHFHFTSANGDIGHGSTVKQDEHANTYDPTRDVMAQHSSIHDKPGMPSYQAPVHHQLPPMSNIGNYAGSRMPLTPIVSGERFSGMLPLEPPYQTSSPVRFPHQTALNNNMMFCIHIEGLNMSPSRLLTFPITTTFAEFYGQTILESSDHAKTQMANAKQCKVQIPGERAMSFNVRDWQREKLWASVVSKARVAADSQESGAGLVEVEFADEF